MRLVDTIKNIWKIEDLRKRLVVTFLLILVYRVGCYVVLPGIDPNQLAAMKSFTSGGLMQLLDMFSGGAFSQALYHGVDRDTTVGHGSSSVPEVAA